MKCIIEQCTSDVLEHKGRVSQSQMKHFKIIYQSISKSITKDVAIVTIIYTLANKYRTAFLPQFPRVLVFSVVSNICHSELPVAFHNKHSQLLKNGSF